MGNHHHPHRAQASEVRAAVLADTRANITENGWTVIAVFATAENPGPSLAYTVGLSARGLPELAVYGLPGRVAHSLLNEVARRTVECGEALQTGERIEGVLVDDVALVAVEMSDVRELNLVREIYGSVAAAVQVVWPNGDGLLPWEAAERDDDGGGDGHDGQPVRGNPPEARPVYRAAELPVSTARGLADWFDERDPALAFPEGDYDPQRDNDIRAIRSAAALVAYVKRVDGGGSSTDDIGSSVSDLLSDIRHLCDALGVEWEAAVASSDTNYREEILGL